MSNLFLQNLAGSLETLHAEDWRGEQERTLLGMAAHALRNAAKDKADAERIKRNLLHTTDTLGYVVDKLKHHHMSKRGIPAIIKEVDKRMMVRDVVNAITGPVTVTHILMPGDPIPDELKP